MGLPPSDQPADTSTGTTFAGHEGKMATKSYSKHKEYKEFSSSGSANAPFAGEQFDMLKSELIPAGSKLHGIGGAGAGGGHREYHYEYREEKLPHGKYDRKDLHTVEEFTVPPKTPAESNSYYYEREERALPAITAGTRTYNYETSSSSTPGYSKVKSTKVTKDLSQNVEELDSLLDDLQKDQERQLYKSGYTSDTAESTSFDYKRGTPVKAPSSGYSTLKREERAESAAWGASPPPAVRSAELRQEMYREEKTESRVVPSPLPAPAPACSHCLHQTSSSTGTLSRSSTPMNKVTTTVKTYTYEVPADQDPAAAPLPPLPDHTHTYVSENEKVHTLSRSTAAPAPAPAGGCAHCAHCNTRVRRDHYSATDVSEHTTERTVYPAPASEVRLAPAAPAPRVTRLEPERNGHGPYSPSTYKYSETSYSSHNTTERLPAARAGPPAHTPTKLDDLLADFPEARFPTEPDGVTRRKVEVTHESAQAAAPARASSRNVAGPAVYYPPGHTPFAKKDAPVAYQAGASHAAMQGGGAHASGRGMYEYESGSKSKQKHSEKKTAVPICLPLCCAMPCVIM